MWSGSGTFISRIVIPISLPVLAKMSGIILRLLGTAFFCELGRGDVDFPAFLAELRKRNYDGWIVVEQDVLPGMGSPYESAERNLRYLNSIL